MQTDQENTEENLEGALHVWEWKGEHIGKPAQEKEKSGERW